MNLTFKTVWDENRQCWIAVQENTRARGKRSKSSRRIGDTTTTSAKSVPSKSSAKSRRKVERPAVVLAAALLGFPSLSALAATLPEGGSLTYGQGQVTQSGNEMMITQSSAKMAIDWNSFNIGQGHKVTFVQPSTSSVAMNRVTGTDVSVIQG
jgi:large exoprotein involved in heme utilization and adhesion